ncbi:MAG: hypothetical protein JO263_08995, partial [Candidatus Eremiobacteraeota bacterium]|nr:hypothetical protein [Candidatus Eremiobacteraeota bacterium]
MLRSAMTLAVAAAVAMPVSGRTETLAYPRMLPLASYLSPNRQAEIDFARSAAPPAISRNATVLVLTAHGYEAAAKGTNGFTCLVERGWMSPFDSPKFWNPKIRGPICYNPAASRTVLLYTIRRTEMVLGGVTKAQMLARVESAVSAGKVPAPEPGSMSYMISKTQFLDPDAGAWLSHLMIYTPKADAAHNGASWGANVR